MYEKGPWNKFMILKINYVKQRISFMYNFLLILMNINKDGGLAECPILSFRDAIMNSKSNDIIYLTILSNGFICATGFLQSQ